MQERGKSYPRSHASPWLTKRRNLRQHGNVSGDMGCTTGGPQLMVMWISDGETASVVMRCGSSVARLYSTSQLNSATQQQQEQRWLHVYQLRWIRW